jgi:hypothetical protein
MYFLNIIVRTDSNFISNIALFSGKYSVNKHVLFGQESPQNSSGCVKKMSAWREMWKKVWKRSCQKKQSVIQKYQNGIKITQILNNQLKLFA